MDVQLADLIIPDRWRCKECLLYPPTDQCDFGLVYLKTGELTIRCTNCFNSIETTSECLLCKNKGYQRTTSGPQPQLIGHFCNIHNNTSTILRLDSLIINKLTKAGLTKPFVLCNGCSRDVQNTLYGKLPTDCHYCNSTVSEHVM